MSDMTDVPSVKVEFRIGRVLSLGIAILFRNILPFGLISLMAAVPGFVYVLAVDPWILLADDQSPGTEFVVNIAETLLGSFLSAAVVYGTAQDLRGRRAGMAACIGRGLAVMVPVLGVAFVTGLLIGLASMALIVPGLIVATMLWVAIPAAVMERRGLSALSRSLSLTRGYRWKVFGLIVLLSIVLVTPILGVYIVAEEFQDNVMPLNGILMALIALYYAATATISTVGYHELRLIKEGASVDEIAAVFD